VALVVHADVDQLAAVGLRYDRAGDVATVTLDRPDRLNAQTPHMWTALSGIGRSLPGDVRVVVLRGAGRAFSAGLDLAMFTPEGLPGAPGFVDIARMADAEAHAAIAAFQDAFTWWSRPDLISVAAVQGHAIGAGFQLALACDLRIVADDVQFCMAEVTRGIVPDLGGTGVLVDLVGYPRALEMCVTGRRVGADEAVQIGLAQLAVPREELDGVVSDLVAALLTPPRDAVIETKALLRGARGRTRDERLEAERSAQLRRLRSLAGLGE
jgi:enoyl-CoA hydratase/carnithine racemase